MNDYKNILINYNYFNLTMESNSINIKLEDFNDFLTK